MIANASSKEKVLKQIRNALIDKDSETPIDVDLGGKIYVDKQESLDIIFAERLLACKGVFLFVPKEEDLPTQLSSLVKEKKWRNIYCIEKRIQSVLTKEKIPFKLWENAMASSEVQVGVTGCEHIVARTGSIIVSSKQIGSRQFPLFPPIHIVVAHISQLVYDLEDAFHKLNKTYGSSLPSVILNITGPSRSADIEKTLILGAHGTRELYVFLIGDHNK